MMYQKEYSKPVNEKAITSYSLDATERSDLLKMWKKYIWEAYHDNSRKMLNIYGYPWLQKYDAELYKR